MRDEMHAARILEATVKAVNLPVTLEKCATGWDDRNRNRAAPREDRADPAASPVVTVHGRTRCRM